MQNSALSFFLMCWTALLAGCQAPSQAPPKRTPNVVFIFADDLGHGDLSSYGSTKHHTPRIDQMAQSGIKFTDFYATYPVCTPSRAALMTGRYPVRYGTTKVLFPESYEGLNSDEFTMGELFQAAGYATICIGKWHLGHRERYLPLQQGFDEYFGIPYSNDMLNTVLMEGNEVAEYKPDQRTLIERYTQRATTFITEHQHEPFFLYLPHTAPHAPHHPGEAFAGQTDSPYGDLVHEIDASTGRILDHLDSLHLLEETLVIFSSDNGPANWLKDPAYNGTAAPFSGGKASTFEGGVRVPTIAYWKGTTPEGQVDPTVGNMMDWMPTFAQLTGATLPYPIQWDGHDLSAVLQGTGDRANQEFFYFFNEDLEAYRNGDWKLKLPREPFSENWGRYAVPGNTDTLLINLRQDPSESHNLAAEYPDKVDSMVQAMQQLHESLGPLPPPDVVTTSYLGKLIEEAYPKIKAFKEQKPQ
ncbi:sulfatase [Pontibacter sp. G13]|uniref:sulfatase family protein n=1 Tax=Pontibacter sp. G13 TaxID=3074898 RepID=UPI00288BB991|nr:sulfatase [Pontibacter sp. G13]WNJ17711.1 sulfatase [Pontibacter sp. G13]